MTVRDFLNTVANYLSDKKGVSYSIKCFNYPEEYQDFYRQKDFILCFGSEKNLDFEKILESELDLGNHKIYGLGEELVRKLKKSI